MGAMNHIIGNVGEGMASSLFGQKVPSKPYESTINSDQSAVASYIGNLAYNQLAPNIGLPTKYMPLPINSFKNIGFGRPVQPVQPVQPVTNSMGNLPTNRPTAGLTDFIINQYNPRNFNGRIR